jgi:putative endonuclease
MKILAENYRCPTGEVDLIALDASTRGRTGRETIAFIEVKTRRSDRYTGPEAAVDPRKRRRIRQAAYYYISRRHADEYATRFDIIAIVVREGQDPELTYIQDAFP